MTSRIERRIAMIEDTLKSGELAPEQAVTLRTELADLRSMATSTDFDAAVTSSRATVNETKTPVKRTRKKAVKAAVQPVVPVVAPPVYRTDTDGQITLAPPSQPQVTVSVGEVKPVTFAKLRGGRGWGLRGMNLLPGQTVQVMKRDNTTVEAVVGPVFWVGGDGETLAYIKGQR